MDLTVRGDYAFLADEAGFGDGGLRVVDVSDPSSPTVIGQETDCPYADGLDVSDDGNTVYIACAADENFAGALYIVDATDKSNPTLLGSVTLPGTPSLPDYNAAHAVVVESGVAYVGNEYGVDEIDIGDAAHPTWTTRYDTGYAVRSLARAPDGRVFAFAAEAGTFVLGPDRIFGNGFD